MKIMVLGVNRFSKFNIWNGQSCFEFITCSVLDTLKSQSIDHYFVECFDTENKCNPDLSQIEPDTDFIIYINWDLPINVDQLKQLSGAKYIFSLLEVPISNMDWCFYFCDYPSEVEKKTKIIAPCNLSIYNQVPKIPKKIVIDHYTGTLFNNRWDFKEGENDWTFRISDWLDGYDVTRMIRFPDLENHTIKPTEKTLLHCDLKQFLQKTDDVDIFIQSHTDGYGYGVIDMAARGVRIFSPPYFLTNDLIEPFGIKIFNDKDELIELINSERESYWSHNYKNCTDYKSIINLIINKFYEIRNSDTAI